MSSGGGLAESPEHNWAAAAGLIYPLLKPPGTLGLDLGRWVPGRVTSASLLGQAPQPLVDAGPGDLVLVYVLHAPGFDAIVNVDHLLTWGIGVDDLRGAALENLARWSAQTPWLDEVSGARRLLSSESGEGWDASRILLPEVRAYLRSELEPLGRVLVGLPERHLLVAGALAAGDEEFALLLARFVDQQHDAADEPIVGRLFELAGDRLIAFSGLGPNPR
jgi:hypothetical protein